MHPTRVAAVSAKLHAESVDDIRDFSLVQKLTSMPSQAKELRGTLQRSEHPWWLLLAWCRLTAAAPCDTGCSAVLLVQLHPLCVNIK
jgi:hypothetical protein